MSDLGSLGFVGILWLVAAGGCDPRDGRPTPSRDPVTADRATEKSAGGADVKPVQLPGRCMKATPSEAVRKTPEPAENCPSEESPRPELATAVVGFEGSEKTVSVELAKEHDHRMRGLMWRTSMAEDDGMLFVFEDERPLSFWMRNTCIPLDMLFITSDGFIVNIEENTPTLTDQNFGSGSCKARYVLEVNAGWTRKNGIKAGMRVKLP